MTSYVNACYWEQGYCVDDDPCQTFTAEDLMRGLVFDRTVQDAPLTLTRVSTKAVHIRRDTGRLYMVDPNTGEILQWDGDNINRLPFEWRSKTFVTPRPVNFGFVQVLLDDISSQFRSAVIEVLTTNASNWGLPCSFGDMNGVEVNEYDLNGSCIEPVPTVDPIYTTLYVYADGILVATINVINEKLHRLPAGYKAMRWAVEVVGNKGVRRITLATTAAEIAQQ